MTHRVLLEAAAANGMRVRFKPGGAPGIVAIVCIRCGYGDGLFDTVADRYEREPYSCPACAERALTERNDITGGKSA